MNASPTGNSVHRADAGCGLALVRVTIGAMFVGCSSEKSK